MSGIQRELVCPLCGGKDLVMEEDDEMAFCRSCERHVEPRSKPPFAICARCGGDDLIMRSVGEVTGTNAAEYYWYCHRCKRVTHLLAGDLPRPARNPPQRVWTWKRVRSWWRGLSPPWK